MINGYVCAARKTRVHTHAQQACLSPFPNTCPLPLSFHHGLENYVRDMWSCSCWFLIASVGLSAVLRPRGLAWHNVSQVVSQSGPAASDGCPLVNRALHFTQERIRPSPSLLCQSEFDWHACWLPLFFLISLKNTLFLARCVKTRACHLVYVCAHEKPEGSSGL